MVIQAGMSLIRHGASTKVSHETIYRFVWDEKKRGESLYKHLINSGKKYRKRGNYKSSRGVIKERISIEERPKTAEEKVHFGDLEIDTVIVKLSGKNAEELANEAVKILKPFENHIYTITSDNGKEFAEHRKISENSGIDFYFAPPYKPCERGCNENANRLTRQYIPKKTDFETVDTEYVNWIQHKLDSRPGKKIRIFNTV